MTLLLSLYHKFVNQGKIQEQFVRLCNPRTLNPSLWTPTMDQVRGLPYRPLPGLTLQTTFYMPGCISHRPHAEVTPRALKIYAK